VLLQPCYIVTCNYRERQRGLVASLEAELEGKLGQLQLLAAENEMLKLRAAVLESTVASREVAVSCFGDACSSKGCLLQS
jgi:hypothetical protein